MSERRDKRQIQIPQKPRVEEWVAQGREKAVRSVHDAPQQHDRSM
jgi:hypothetical protein